MARPPLWQLPPGVSPGTWDYTHTKSIADGYDDFLKTTPLVRLDLQLTERYLPPARKDTATLIADLGCGSGRTAIPLSQAGYRVLGVDLSQSMLQRMATAAAEVDTPVLALRANLVQLDAIADATIDHAICLFSTLGMIRQRRHRRQFLRHTARMLRPGGTFLVHAHHRRAWLRHPGGLRQTLSSLWKSVTSDHEFGDHVYAYRNLADMYLHSFSRRELVADLQHAGFKIEQVLRIDINGESVLPPWAPQIAGGFFVIGQKAGN